MTSNIPVKTNGAGMVESMQKIGNYVLHGNPDEEGIEKVNFRLEEKKYW